MTDVKLNTCAFVVTYNRLDLLKECIAGIRNQQIYPDCLLVINNGSTDGTAKWLNDQIDIKVITLKNEGPANAFKIGFEFAIQNNFDWVWCMDDDTIPQENALSGFYDFYLNLTSAKQKKLGFMASEVLWIDMSICISNLPWFVDERKSNEILACTFVSSIYSVPAIRKVELPRKEFFQWYVDVEYSWRISELFDGYYVPGSKVIHKTKQNVKVKWKYMNSESFEKYAGGLINYIYLMKNNVYKFSMFKRLKGVIGTLMKAYFYTIINTKPVIKNIKVINGNIIKGLNLKILNQ